MSGENPACAKQKSRSGPSGWKKYNAWRSETGQRIDPYVRKRPSGSVQPGVSAIFLGTAVAETSVLPAVSGSARQQHAAADPLSTAIVPALNAKRSDSAVAERIRPSQDSAVAEGVTIHAATPSQESAVAEGVPLHAAAPSQGSAVAAEASRRSIGVGEHLSGEAFLWRGIWDMP